jgi:hypothetical protein
MELPERLGAEHLEGDQNHLRSDISGDNGLLERGVSQGRHQPDKDNLIYFFIPDQIVYATCSTVSYTINTHRNLGLSA